ncbi:MAG: glycosyltransferase family 2 protein, partial [Verrucomicrobia bacterium]|nr:glycosyltransferase family 2 protein [Verrucomicrobiota bacterium]
MAAALDHQHRLTGIHQRACDDAPSQPRSNDHIIGSGHRAPDGARGEGGNGHRTLPLNSTPRNAGIARFPQCNDRPLMPNSGAPKVYIIILNTRTKQETVDCLLSLEAATYRAFEVVVVENCSGDDSLAFIQGAVTGRVSYPVHFLESPANDGFGAGNNVGLRFAMARGDGRYYWVLNNDTIVPSDTLSVQVQAAEEDRRAGRRIGQYGLKLRYHSHPDLLQAVGGTYNKWLSITREIGNLERDEGQYDRRAPRPDILIGASLFVSDEFLREVGLLGEDYFIYYEEHDWAVRGRRRGWGLRVLSNGLVYH